MPCILWHNPRCSKSRAALDLLRSRGIEPLVRDYLQDPPTRDELAAVAAALDAPLSAMLRPSESEFAKLGLASADDAARLDAMAAHPQLIERPLLICDGRAVIGRPPERLLELLG